VKACDIFHKTATIYRKSVFCQGILHVALPPNPRSSAMKGSALVPLGVLCALARDKLLTQSSPGTQRSVWCQPCAFSMSILTRRALSWGGGAIKR